MPEEIEVPTEHLHEHLHEKAHEGGFNLQVALTSALVAVLAAICALFAGSYANEAMLKQLQASDQWSYYQAKGIKAAVLESKMDVLKALHRPVDAKDAAKAAQYKGDQAAIQAQADGLAKESEAALARHELLSKGVTLFQVAIALSAIAVLANRRFLFYAGLALSVGGSLFLALGLLPR